MIHTVESFREVQQYEYSIDIGFSSEAKSRSFVILKRAVIVLAFDLKPD
jgi:hypothetical protein